MLIFFLGHFTIGIILAGIGLYRTKKQGYRIDSEVIDVAVLVTVCGYVSLFIFILEEIKK